MERFSPADKRRMYGDLAWAWPIISPPEDYVTESEEYIRLIKKYARIPVNKVVNLGCGGGHNDFTLKGSFQMTGVDISEPMLELARRLNPEVAYSTGDMRSVRLGQSFDAVTVFDSIAYMRTAESLKSAFLTAFTHLRPGGVFLTCIEESRETFRQNKVRYSSHSKDDIDIALIENYFDPNPHDSHYEATFIYLIRHAGELKMETDCHLLGLFEFAVWPEMMRQIGFEVHQHQSSVPDQEGNSCPLLIGVKPV